MPEWLIELLSAHPSYTYVAVGSIFLLCGVGLPLPEEIVLVSAGFLCHQGHADYGLMTATCAVAILAGDIIPFWAGRAFGPRLLRLRWMRFIINRTQLAMFDRWFRRRGDLVVVIARFIPGLRVVAFFTGGTMRMRWMRFLVLDGCGILLIAPALVFVGWHFGEQIEAVIENIRQVENSILWIAGVGGALLGGWYWLRRRARRRRLVAGPSETFVGPRAEPEPTPEPVAGTAADPAADPAGESPTTTTATDPEGDSQAPPNPVEIAEEPNRPGGHRTPDRAD